MSNLPQEGRNSIREAFRLMILNSNSSENSKRTLENGSVLTGALNDQITRNLEGTRTTLNTQTMRALDTAINEKVISQTQVGLEVLREG